MANSAYDRAIDERLLDTVDSPETLCASLMKLFGLSDLYTWKEIHVIILRSLKGILGGVEAPSGKPVDKKTEMPVDAGSEPCSPISPAHYKAGGMETAEKIEAVVDELSARGGIDAVLLIRLSHALKYFDRAGLKGDASEDLEKCANYLYRMFTGKWIE